MARPGVTYEQAECIFIKILAQGEALSAQSARLTFGSGSNSTWSKHLGKFREEQREKQLVSLPETLPEALVPVLETIWVQAVNKAGEQFVQDREAFNHKMTELGEQLQALQSRYDHLETDCAEANELHKKAVRQSEKQAVDLLEKEDLIRQLNEKLENERQRCRNTEKRVAELQQDIVEQQEKSLQGMQAMDLKFQHETKRNEEAEAKWMQLYDSAKLEIKKAEKEVTSLKKKLTESKAAQQHSEKLVRENQKLLTKQEGIEGQLRVIRKEFNALREDRDKLDRAFSLYKVESQGQLKELFELRLESGKLNEEIKDKNCRIEQLTIDLAKLNAEQGIQTQLLASIKQLRAG